MSGVRHTSRWAGIESISFTSPAPAMPMAPPGFTRRAIVFARGLDEMARVVD